MSDVSYLPGLLGVAPRVCRELASMSMIVLRSNTGGARVGLQIVITQSHLFAYFDFLHNYGMEYKSRPKK